MKNIEAFVSRSAVVFGFIFLVLFLSSSQLYADTILLTQGAGILTGATGVNVGGVLYDVAFVDGACETQQSLGSNHSISSTCTLYGMNSPLFSAGGLDPRLASQALLDQVFVGSYGTSPNLTNGCLDATSACNVLTLYSWIDNSSGTRVAGLLTYDAINFGNQLDLVSDYWISQNSGVTANIYDTTHTNEVFAVWSPTAVPELSSVWMLGLGLIALVITRGDRELRQAYLRKVISPD